MTFLLDTNVWLWGYSEPDVLPAEIQAILASRQTQFGLSAISLWEVAKKHQHGKMELKQELGVWLRGAVAAHIQLLPLTPEIVADAMNLPVVDAAHKRAANAAEVFFPRRSNRSTRAFGSTNIPRVVAYGRNPGKRNRSVSRREVAMRKSCQIYSCSQSLQTQIPCGFQAIHPSERPT